MLADRVVLEAAGASARSTAFRFARDYARLQEGWRSLGDPGWPMLPPAPGTILAASRDALNSLLRSRLRRARIVTLHQDGERRREAIAWLHRSYGDTWKASDQRPASEHREVILLVTPDCRRDIAADHMGFLRWARTLLRDHPDALALSLPVSGGVPPLQPLAALLLEAEATLGREPDHPTPGTVTQSDAPHEVSPAEPADDPDSDEPAPGPS